MKSDETTRRSAEANDWEQELDDIRALCGSDSKVPPKKAVLPPVPHATAAKRRPSYRPGSAYEADDNLESSFFQRHRFFLLFILMAVFLSLLTGVLSYASSHMKNAADKTPRIAGQISVGGIDVSGMTSEAAELALQNAFSDWQMSVTINGQTILLPDAAVDIPGIMADISQYIPGDSILSLLQLQSRSASIGMLPYLQLNQAEILRQINELNISVRPSSCILSDELPSLEKGICSPETVLPVLLLDPGTSGQGVDSQSVLQQIVDAYDAGLKQLNIAADISVRHPDALNLDAAFAEICVLPSAESYGFDFDIAAAKSLLATAQPGEIIQIPLRLLKPLDANISAEFPDVLASYETSHNNDPMRNQNIALVCQMLDGYIIQPGDTFSFNEIVGERTAARGFVGAPVYPSYHNAQPVGGGLIQNTTTLYICALLAELEIVERENAQYQPGFVQSGFDADIGWPGPDLKLRNNTGHPVKIVCHNEDETLYTQILGTDTRNYDVAFDRDVTQLTSQTVYRDVAPGTYSNGQIMQYGSNGAYIQSYLCKINRQTGECMERVPLAFSSYPNNNTIIARVAP